MPGVSDDTDVNQVEKWKWCSAVVTVKWQFTLGSHPEHQQKPSLMISLEWTLLLSTVASPVIWDLFDQVQLMVSITVAACWFSWVSSFQQDLSICFLYWSYRDVMIIMSLKYFMLGIQLLKFVSSEGCSTNISFLILKAFFVQVVLV